MLGGVFKRCNPERVLDAGDGGGYSGSKCDVLGKAVRRGSMRVLTEVELHEDDEHDDDNGDLI